MGQEIPAASGRISGKTLDNRCQLNEIIAA